MKTGVIAKVVTGKEGGTMKIGEIIRVKDYSAIPGVVGEQAEIINLQTQEFEEYTVYPVWARITTGERKGRVYGFHYDEVEMLPKALPEETTRAKVAEQLEEILGGVSQVETGREEKALRMGVVVKIEDCSAIPQVVGELGEIVNLQTEEFEEYTIYPVWVRITTGERKGKVYGFHYDEVEVLPRAHPEETTRIKVVERLEEMLRVMKTGGTVRIKKCDAMPELVGEGAEIVDLQTQDLERYATYPVWARVTSGERTGKVYGFHYDEVELLPKVHLPKATMTKLDKQLEEILSGITTIDEIAEVERAISEVKGKVLAEPGQGFWEGKTPCWEMLRCPEEIRNECPAFKHQGLPCWQIEGTYSKLHDNAQRGCNTDICQVCRVYKRCGQDEPIEIKLVGKGFNQASEELR